MGSNTRANVAVKITAGVRQFENLIDETLIGGAEFVAIMLRGRHDAKLAAAVGHDALEEVFSACNHALDARRAMVRGHARLEELRRQLNLPEVADGGKTRMPEPSGMSEEVPETMTARVS